MMHRDGLCCSATNQRQAFHISAQRDSLVASRIADLARTDSASVRTISILGLVFLPGTFVSVSYDVITSAATHCTDGSQGIFGMNFFDLSRGEDDQHMWTVSSKFWVYWAVTLPLTLATILVWHLQHRPAFSSA
jgi:hypothetical protein